MINFLKRYYTLLIGGLAGSLIGFAYYYFVGCGTDTCSLHSNPFISIIFGAMFGLLLADLFRKK